MAKRITVRVSDDVFDKVMEWSKKLGVTQSQLGGMAVHSGIDAIIRAVSPVDSLSADQWAQIVQAMDNQGVNVDQLKKDVGMK